MSKPSQKQSSQASKDTKSTKNFSAAVGYQLNNAVTGNEQNYAFVTEWFRRQRIDALKYNRSLLK